jgi:hypothetical protein
VTVVLAPRAQTRARNPDEVNELVRDFVESIERRTM